MRTVEQIEIVRKAIHEARKAGSQEMSNRRTNLGIAGDIATKLLHRPKRDGNDNPLPYDKQVEELAEWLTDREISHIASYLSL